MTVVSVERSGLGIDPVDSRHSAEVLFHELDHLTRPVHVVRADAGEAGSLGSLHRALEAETEAVAVLPVHAHHDFPVGNGLDLSVLSFKWPATLGVPLPDSRNDPLHVVPPDSSVLPPNLSSADLRYWRPVEYFHFSTVGTRAALERIPVGLKPHAGLSVQDLSVLFSCLSVVEHSLRRSRVVDQEHVLVERNGEDVHPVSSEPRRVTESTLRAEGPRELGESRDEQFEVQVDYVRDLHRWVNLVLSGWLGFHE